MKNLISILTASAAGLVIVGAANAADLPSKKAAPAQYVRVCDTYGAGFFYAPGSTDTCLKVGGYVRAEYRLRSHPLVADNETFFRARGLVALDSRTATSYGVARTFIQMRFTDDTGQASSATILQNAYVEWAGITAGRRVNSFFDFYAHDQEWIGVTTSADQLADVLAYTAKFGGGFTATVSLENPVWRQQANNGAIASTKQNGLGTAGIGTGNIGYNVAGTRLPDVIGRLRVDQDWGSAQLTAAFHQNTALGASATNGTAPTTYATNLTSNAKVNGYAVQAGVKVNLPMLAKGDSFLVQAAYSSGATEFVNSNDIGSVWASLAHISVPMQSAIPTSATTLGAVKSWSVVGEFEHFWSPTLKQALFGSYMQLKQPTLTAAISPNTGVYNNTTWIVGTRAVWMPVAGLDIGPEITYENTKLKAVANGPALPAVSSGSDIRAAFRIQKAF